MKIKPIYRFFIWLLLLCVIIVSFLAYYFQHHEKDLFLTALRSSINQNINASDVDYDFPLGFHLDGFIIDGVIQAKRLSVQFDPMSFKEKKLILSSLVLYNPVITWRRARKIDASAQSPQQQPVPLSEAAAPADEGSTTDTKLIVKRLIIKNGRLHYIDEANANAFSFQLGNLQMKVDDLVFPLIPNTATFLVVGTLVKENASISGSVVKSNGWINLAQKDMDADLLILEADGKTGLSAHATAKNNDMTVKGKIKAGNLFNQEPGKPLESAVDNIVLTALSNIGVEIGADFSFNTKLDDFTIGQISFSGSVSTHSDPATGGAVSVDPKYTNGATNAPAAAAAINPVAR